MKRTLIILILSFALCAHAQTNFYTNVTNLWYQGYKSNVLAIANQRLQQNTNDIAGLILKMEYYPAERSNLLEILDFIKENPLSPAELAIEQAKGNINQKPLPTPLIEALPKDGYFD